MIKDNSGFLVQGHIKIFDPDTKEIFINKRNAIHPENVSIAMANSWSNSGAGQIYQMVFGNGGTSVDPTGIITYLTPNTIGTNSSLYNQTYAKVVDATSSNNTDPTRNNMTIMHVTGSNYTDIVVTCFLDYTEPSDQDAFDNSTYTNGAYVFDELGLVSYNPNGNGILLTHVIFHPQQKSLNRALQIEYTIRVMSLTSVGG